MVTRPGGGMEDVYVAMGTVDCTTAVTPITRYFTDTSLSRQGSRNGAQFDGWDCGNTTGVTDLLPYNTSCQRDNMQTRVVTVDHGTPWNSGAVDPGLYRNDDGSGTDIVYFSSLSGKWHCAITASVAGCNGPFPASAPRVPGVTPGTIMPPNTVRMLAGRAAEFIFAGGADFTRDPSRVLPYDQTLRHSGVTCNIDERAGVTCKSGAHGFTVSTEQYALT